MFFYLICCQKEKFVPLGIGAGEIAYLKHPEVGRHGGTGWGEGVKEQLMECFVSLEGRFDGLANSIG